MTPPRPTRPATLAILVALVAPLLLPAPPARAQDDPQADPLADPLADTPDNHAGPVAIVWCHAQDNAEQRLFVSDPAAIPVTSRVALRAYGGRFGSVVNARYGQHLILERNYCGQFGSRTAAAAARATLVGRMAAQNFRIVNVGTF